MGALYLDVLCPTALNHINVEVIAIEHLPIHRQIDSIIHVNTFA